MKPKAEGRGIEMKTITKGKSTFLVFRLKNAFHVLKEVEAKDVARKYFGETEGVTRDMWKHIWKNNP